MGHCRQKEDCAQHIEGERHQHDIGTGVKWQCEYDAYLCSTHYSQLGKSVPGVPQVIGNFRRFGKTVHDHQQSDEVRKDINDIDQRIA